MADDTDTHALPDVDAGEVAPPAAGAPPGDTPANATTVPEGPATRPSAETGGGLDGGAEHLAALRDELVALRRDFESRLLYDATKQQQLDTLHTELEQYRRGFHLQILRPLLTDLIALYGGLGQVAARLGALESEVGAEAAREFTSAQEQIEETLRRVGVERYSTPGAEFDAKRQRAISSVDTADPALDKRVAQSLRPGFIYEDRVVLQPEQVATYSYHPPTGLTADAPPNAD